MVTDSEIVLDVSLAAKEEAGYVVTLSCERDGEGRELVPPEKALSHASKWLHQSGRPACTAYTNNEQFNGWLRRSTADLQMMISETPSGLYPYAGVPWFSTVFGRDGIITGLEYLWVDPRVARGVLGFLASTQATEVDPEGDAEPGKILHEMRNSEMALLGEVPFRRYYGSIDSTPLFLLLAGEYFERTGDEEFLRSIWPNIELALEWIDQYGDVDGDGFVEYARQNPRGLVQQGWKDSHDSVFHADGSSARGPIALCEVQGYVYAAKSEIAQVADALGYRERALQLNLQAEELRDRFEEAFWCDEISTYALALDGEKRQCRVRTSNAGHCLFTGIGGAERAGLAAETLTTPDGFSGWGVRTLAASECRYNPMSYHNGSVWPHDNAIVASGLARFGRKDLAGRILTGMFQASVFIELHRMPELFCGFVRRPGKGPTLYPVACSPQAWASGAVFMMLEACLGLSIRARERQVRLLHPMLPEWLTTVEISHLKVGHGSVDLLLRRHEHVVSVEVKRRDGDVEIVTVS
jgi:glycogen debranching enzyme